MAGLNSPSQDPSPASGQFSLLCIDVETERQCRLCPLTPRPSLPSVIVGGIENLLTCAHTAA